MKKVKILLGDPRHYTVGAHSSYVPINIGYIGSFLKQEIKNIELKLEVEPKKIFSAIDNWKPDVIGMSNYVWNASLSNLICDYAKKINKNTLCILGGPEFPAGTGNRKIQNTEKEPTYDKCLHYLTNRPSVDYFAYSDGEVVFVEVIKKFIEKKFSVKSMKEKDQPVKGCASISKDNKKLLVGDYISRIGMQGSVKSEGRDIVPSPYLTGLLDKFLNGKFEPAFETSRGCPFLCTFCDQGIDESKIATHSTNRVAEEMRYVGKKMHGIENGTKTISVFDANWGIYKKDIELADHIAKIMDDYDWPKYINCSTPKTKRENLLKIDDKLKNRVGIGLPMQSLNTNVLKEVKRKNLDAMEQLKHIREIQKRGKTANTELIIPLPGETEQSYFEGLKFLMDNGVMTATFTLIQLCGAELGRDEAIKKHNMVSKYRILPKQFGEYNGKKVFEIERVCVSTNTMSLENYLKCRNHSFIVKIMGQQVFTPVRKLTQKLGLSWFDITKEVANYIQKDSSKGKFKKVYEEFCNESAKELFDSEKDAVKFYSKAKNYRSLVDGNIGENLLEKYMAKGLLVYEDIIKNLFFVMRKKFTSNFDKNLKLVLDSSEKWLKNLYMLEEIFNEKKAKTNFSQYELEIDFDFPNWLLESHLPFSKFIKKSTYKVNYNMEKIKYCKTSKKTLDKGFNKVRAVGRFIRSHMCRGADTFEKQFQKVS